LVGGELQPIREQLGRLCSVGLGSRIVLVGVYVMGDCCADQCCDGRGGRSGHGGHCSDQELSERELSEREQRGS